MYTMVYNCICMFSYNLSSPHHPRPALSLLFSLTFLPLLVLLLLLCLLRLLLFILCLLLRYLRVRKERCLSPWITITCKKKGVVTLGLPALISTIAFPFIYAPRCALGQSSAAQSFRARQHLRKALYEGLAWS